MRLSVDTARCEGHGACAAINDELFVLDDDGFSAVADGTDVPDDLLKDARDGVDACPLVALRLEP